MFVRLLDWFDVFCHDICQVFTVAMLHWWQIRNSRRYVQEFHLVPLGRREQLSYLLQRTATVASSMSGTIKDGCRVTGHDRIAMAHLRERLLQVMGE
jgi:hypothetical protein